MQMSKAWDNPWIFLSQFPRIPAIQKYVELTWKTDFLEPLFSTIISSAVPIITLLTYWDSFPANGTPTPFLNSPCPSGCIFFNKSDHVVPHFTSLVLSHFREEHHPSSQPPCTFPMSFHATTCSLCPIYSRLFSLRCAEKALSCLRNSAIPPAWKVLKFINFVLFFFQLIFHQPFLCVNFTMFNHGKS